MAASRAGETLVLSATCSAASHSPEEARTLFDTVLQGAGLPRASLIEQTGSGMYVASTELSTFAEAPPQAATPAELRERRWEERSRSTGYFGTFD